MNKLFNIISYNSIAILCCIILLGGCKDVNPITPDGLVEVKFGTGIEVLSKATGSTSTKTTPDGDEWISGDAVGIFMVSESGSIPSDILTVNYLKVDNIEYTVTPDGSDASSGTLTEAGDKIYYPQDGSEVDFISYYPYTFFSPTDSHIYPVFLGDQDYPEYIDILWGKSSGYSKGSATDRVTIEMNHVLSKVTFNLKAGDGVEDELTDAMIIIKGLPEYVDIDLNDGSIDDIGEAIDIYPKDIVTIDGYDSSYQVITTPIASPYSQGVAIMVILTSGEIYELKIPEGHSFTAGMSHNYGLKVSALGLTLENHSINKWTVTEIRDNGGFSKPGIRTAEELVQFSKDWNATDEIINDTEREAAQQEVIRKWSDNGQIDGTINLWSDIDMKDIPDFKPIGSFNETEWFDYGFAGKFDGNGHTISNLTIDVVKYAGLFGYISGGSISNTIIKDCNIAAEFFVGGIAGCNDYGTITDCSMIGGVVVATDSYVGGIVGYTTGESARIENCTVSGTSEIKANYRAGGIAGINSQGTITDCEMTGGTVTATNEYSGGIAGWNDGEYAKIENCTVSGASEIEANYRAGGIAGINSQGTITDCEMTGGTVTATNEYSGGITGWNDGEYAKIENCTVSGASEIKANYLSGGIAGLNTDGTITGCKMVDGRVIATENAGGIVGYTTGESARIENCTVSGASEIKANYLSGGIAGLNNDGTITGCKMVDGRVIATENAGGIAGQNSGTNAKIENCTVSGTTAIDANWNAGGIAGFNYQGTITGCSTTDGTVTANEYAGGITGWNDGEYAKIENCTVSGASEIEAEFFAGGIAGLNNDGTITGCKMVDGRVIATENAGGIAGQNSGTNAKIENCTISGVSEIHADYDVGGITGWNEGTITGCSIIDGIITATENFAGGIAGYNYSGTITSCISVPESVSGINSIGIVTGKNEISTITTCFWSATADVTDAVGVGDPMTDGGEFDKADVKETDNFFSTNFESTGKTPIELMNEALEAALSTWRWKAGDATSGWYPVSFNTSN